MSGLTDINGDGLDDLIIGAPVADPDGRNEAGERYVIFGSTGLGGSGTVDLSGLDGSDGFVIKGIDKFDDSGGSVSGAGDINGDGLGDLVIGAAHADLNNNFFVGASAGESYVVFGASGVGSTGEFQLSDLDGTNGFMISGLNMQDRSGTSVSGAGDINSDGVDDLIVGAPGARPNNVSGSGQSYVLFGGSSVGSLGEIDVSNLDGSNGFLINGTLFSEIGRTVSGLGDINGDGVDDLITASGSVGSGVFVVFGGRAVGNQGVVEGSELDGRNGIKVSPSDRTGSFGVSVSGVGDVNGDGLDDFIRGADDENPNGKDSAGQSYVIFGRVVPQCNDRFVTVDLNYGETPGPGPDVVLGTPGSDDIRGRAGDDTICGMGGNDFIHGNSGNDWIDGGDGVDDLRGGQGDDQLNGEAGEDFLSGGGGELDVCEGGGAVDIATVSCETLIDVT